MDLQENQILTLVYQYGLRRGLIILLFEIQCEITQNSDSFMCV